MQGMSHCVRCNVYRQRAYRPPKQLSLVVKQLQVESETLQARCIYTAEPADDGNGVFSEAARPV